MRLLPFIGLITIIGFGSGSMTRSQEAPYAVQAPRALVRGRIQRSYNGQFYPIQGVQVTLNHPQLGRTDPAYSGPDGMYYLYNIPPGSYYLEVWVTNPPWVFNVNVYAPQTDLPPVNVP